MARKPKAPKPKLDRTQEKARKQKRMAAILSVVFVGVLVFEVPKTMKLMNAKAKAPVVEASASTPAAPTPTVTTPSSTSGGPPVSTPAAAPSAPGALSAATSGLVSAVAVTPDPGQLTQFARFASKDPFLQTIQKNAATATSSSSGSTPAAGGKKKTSTTPATPKTPPAPPSTSAVVSLNGELMTVSVGGAFPTAGVTFSRVGSLFKLDSLTGKSAKVSIVGGSYANGAGELTLTVGQPVTLQNTADGTRYTLILEPAGTVVPTTTSPASTVPTSTTPSVVPSSPSG